ncbi:MAG: ParB/RepB/Spo0J family partition protein [Mollicutes bacterium]|nr:ParB/RepB/Spo0J family partition protein [Mollicutes bacterium]
MKRDKPKLLSDSLSSLIEKFSQSDVIAEMEKEYQSAPAKLISTLLIDDTSFIQEVPLPDKTIRYFAEGLKSKGFYNPLVVRKKGEGRYEVILGRKRFFGAKAAGILSLPCAVVDCGDEETLLMLLADARDQRETNILEMALLCHALSEKFGYRQQTLANLSHQSRCQITNTMRLLKLPASVRYDVALGKLSYGQARALVSLPTPLIDEAAKAIQKNHWSVRKAEEYCKKLQGKENKPLHVPSISYKKGNTVSLTFSSEEEMKSFLKKAGIPFQTKPYSKN